MDCNRIIQGDCVQGLRQIETGIIDLVFADPPFNIGYEYDVYDDRCQADKYLDWSRLWGQEVRRVLKPAGTFWLAIGDEYAAELKLIFQKDLGLTCRSWVIWYYTFGVNCTRKFSRSHAHLFHFVKDPKRFTFNSQAIKVPSARQLVYADARAVESGRLPDDTWILRPQDVPAGFRPYEDTWYFRRVCGTFKERAGWHGCQMPEQLLGRIIKACSNPGDVVLDPFAGSGTTLAVAKKLQRQWIGFELSPNYVTRIQDRLESAKPGHPLEGAEDPIASAPATPSRSRAQGARFIPLSSQPRREASEVRRGILEAFFAIREGFALDRVIADPALNQRFREACHRLGLPGQPGHWNRQLMNLRKAGWLAGLPRSRQSSFSRQAIEQCSFACEIALQHFREVHGRTLDHILCEPAEADEFDRFVQSIISEKLSPFQIRWVALYIRKRATKNRRASQELTAFEPLPKNGQAVDALDLGRVPPNPGLYWLRGPGRPLYVGETLDLRRRFQLQFETSGFGFWDTPRRELDVRYCVLPDGDNTLLGGNQSHWIARWKPVGNFSGFAAV